MPRSTHEVGGPARAGHQRYGARSRIRAAAARTGRLGAGAMLVAFAVLAGAPPSGAAGAQRLRPLDAWDEVSLRWLAPIVGGVSAPPTHRRGRIRDARRTAVVARMLRAGDRIARLPYRWGGGHGSFVDTGYDCSGSVSYVLHAAGLLASPEASGALAGYGSAGPGRRVTIYANAQHALVTVDGRRFDTIALERTGSRWAPRAGSIDGYVVRHPAGL